MISVYASKKGRSGLVLFSAMPGAASIEKMRENMSRNDEIEHLCRSILNLVGASE